MVDSSYIRRDSSVTNRQHMDSMTTTYRKKNDGIQMGVPYQTQV